MTAPSLRIALVALSVGLAPACKGPDAAGPTTFDVVDPGMLAVQWQDGPRRENAQLEVQKNAREIALRLFPDAPMGAQGANTALDASAKPATAPNNAPRDPAWVDGVPKPAEAAELDFPRAFPVEVRRGETPPLLAEWARVDPSTMLAENAEALGNRRWLKTGDRIQIVMSPNQKAVFDRRRENFQRERIEAFFARRYFEKVVLYRVKRGEYIAQVAKRLGDVPLWLIEEFNQTDFRGLQPGDEIMIPVIANLEPGQEAPQGLLVVDEEGRPIAAEKREALKARLQGEFPTQARMALDDGNVFMRPRPGQPVAGAAVAAHAGYPRPTPAARIGASDAVGMPTYGAAPVADANIAGAQDGATANAGAEVGPPNEVAGLIPRPVVVKRGESLSHYMQWSQTPLEAILRANPHLDPDRIFVGTRIAIPMADEQFTRFVLARAAWEAERTGGSAQAAPGSKDPAKPTRIHVVKSGETATNLARKYKISVQALKSANPKVDLKKLRAGQKLEIPAKR
jgi:LysM repeat protein